MLRTRSFGLVALLLLCWGIGPRSQFAGELSLSRRIDLAIESQCAGPLGEICTDAEFVRRIHLDLIGRVPSSADARQFLDEPSSLKRLQLVDRLLASPDFARRMQHVFSIMWMERRPDKSVPGPEWSEFLRRAFLENRPLNKLATEILSADGADAARRPAAKFYLDRDGEPNLLTRDVGRLFLGMDLQCAQCHDHPLIEGYKQEDYYGLFAFFSRSFIYTDPQKVAYYAEKAEGDVTYKSVFDSSGTVHPTGPHLPRQNPLTEPGFEKGQEYLVPPADTVRPVPRFSRRELLAQELTNGTNADFNRNIANRLWALMLGRGIVDPVDFCHPDNPPSHPELLDMLAAELVAQGFDVRSFLREIAASRTYQRTSELPAEATDETCTPSSFAVAALKPLSPEQLTWSVMTVAGFVDSYRAAAAQGMASDPRLEELLATDERRSARRAELIEAAMYEQLKGYEGTFVSLYGGAPGQPQQAFQPTVQQALFLSNGDLIRGWFRPGAGAVVDRLNALADPADLAEELYLTLLSRRPSREEAAEVTAYLATRSEDRGAAVAEMTWGLLASSEFRFNH